MTFADPLLLKCPFCGEEKEVLSLKSGNTFRAQKWSDLKIVYPMLPKVSPVQKCPSCGKYYFTEYVEKRENRGGICGEEGNLTYWQLKEAVAQFGSSLPSGDYSELPYEDYNELNMLLLWGYNDLFNREGVKTVEPPPEEKSYIDNVLGRLNSGYAINPILRAEFNRERGKFEKALFYLDSCHPEHPILADIVERMKSYAKDEKIIAFKV